jgi:hypothetical protein
VAFRDDLLTAQTVTGQLFTLPPRNGRTKRLHFVDRNGRPTTVNAPAAWLRAAGHLS